MEKNWKEIEYIKKYSHDYYLEHKKKMLGQNKQWRKDNPEKVKEINRRYYEKVRVATIRYKNKGLKLKELYRLDYGKNLEKSDRVYQDGKKIFCLDCIDRKNCNGWDNCKYRNEVLEMIKR
jgi:hypothetical protein